MIDLDPVLLARVQFAANITFHILFPTITIALAWFLLFFKLRFNATGDQKWMACYRFWVKIFALCFALGVVSGVTMSFQFGTNWPGFMEHVGNVAGPLLAYEVLTAFFLEATFLGIMLFGMHRVSNTVHTLATFLVAIGTTFSAFWILVLNSWMQTPEGFTMADGVAYVTSWWAVLFNPSMPYRIGHMLLASGLTACFLMAGLSAYRWLRQDRGPDVLAALKSSIYVAAILVPLQIFLGDAHGLNTLKYQPEKIAAIEAIWETERGAPLVLFAVPDSKLKKNLYEVKIPKLASLILTHSWDGELKGIEEFGDKHPPVPALFYGFRIMVGVGILMLLTAWLGVWQLRRYRREGVKAVTPILSPWFARWLVVMTFSGWLATLAGWYVTEVGRQPWLVYNVLLTAEAAATNVTSPMIVTSLLMYLGLYLFLIVAFISVVFYMAGKAGGSMSQPGKKVGGKSSSGI